MTEQKDIGGRRKMKSCNKHKGETFYYHEDAYPNGCPLCIADKMTEEAWKECPDIMLRHEGKK